MKFITNSEKESFELGKKFAKKLKPGDIVFLHGNLGYGKTTFVKGVAKGFDVNTRVISPTYVIIRKHVFKKKSKLKPLTLTDNLRKAKIMNLYHIDLYRVDNAKQIEEAGVSEILKDKYSVKLVEWPDKLDKKEKRNWDIVFNLENEQNKRSITIKSYG